MGHERAIAAAGESPVRYRFTVEDLLRLDEAGAFADAWTELIDGEIFVLSPVHVPHSMALARVTAAFLNAIDAQPAGLVVYSPVSTRLDRHNLPQPDLLVGARTTEPLVDRHSARLAVEIAYSSLQHDLVKKAELYARFGIPEYWVFDVKGRRVVRLAEPTGGEYRRRDEFRFGVSVEALTIPGLTPDLTKLADL